MRLLLIEDDPDFVKADDTIAISSAFGGGLVAG